MQHIIEIPEIGKTFYLPIDLAQCNAKQFIDMAQLIMLFQTQVLTYEEMRVQAVYKLLNMQPVVNVLNEEQENKLSNIYLISRLIDSFFDFNENQKIIKLNFVHNPLGKFSPMFKNYYGFNNLFENITWAEYTDALRLFNDFNKTPSTETLISLAAMLYKPKKKGIFIKKIFGTYNGNHRANHNLAVIKQTEKAFKKAPIGFLYGVYLVFASFQKHLSTAVIPWAGKNLDFSILFNSSQKNELNVADIGFDSVTFLISEAGTFGNKHQLSKTPFWEVFIKLYDLTIQNKLKKQDYDKHKSSS